MELQTSLPCLELRYDSFTMNSGKISRLGFSRIGVNGKLVLVPLALVLISGCATMDSNTPLGQSLSQIGNKMKGGIQRVTSRGPSTKSRQSNSALFISAQYPTNEMPHTMMKKPVGDGRLSSGYGYRINPKGVRLPKRHNGIDYAAPTGTAVYAAADGVIDKIYVSESYGNYIRIEHDNDFYTAYAHMHVFADGLDAGSKVSRGDVIGQVGSTGKSSGPHLHFELIHKGKFIDPLFETVQDNVIASDDGIAGDT